MRDLIHEWEVGMNVEHKLRERGKRGGAGEEGCGWNGRGGEGRQLEERAVVGQWRDKRGRVEGLVEYVVPCSFCKHVSNCFIFEWVYSYIVLGVSLSELSLVE